MRCLSMVVISSMSSIGSLSILERWKFSLKHVLSNGVILVIPWNRILLRGLSSTIVILAGLPDRALSIWLIGGGRALVILLEGGGGCVSGSMITGCVEGDSGICGVDGSNVSSLITCTESLACGGDVLPKTLLFLVVTLRWDRSLMASVVAFSNIIWAIESPCRM